MKKGSKTSEFGTTSRVSHDSSAYYDSKLYSELKAHQDTKPQPDNPFPEELVNSVIQGSAESMNQLPNNCLHLMITSPPYNVSKVYDEDLSLREYLDLLHRVLSETYRVLVYGGRACVNVANVGRKPYIALSDHISHMMLDIGFSMRGEIIWNKAAGAGVSMAWGSWKSASNPVLRDVHEYILVFCKGSFKRLDKGKESTIESDQFMEWTKSVWTFNPESARKVGHPAPFPVELPYRLIQLYTFKNDIILDPFMGSGTTGVAALKAERKYVGYDIDPKYVELAESRLKLLKMQMTTDSTKGMQSALDLGV